MGRPDLMAGVGRRYIIRKGKPAERQGRKAAGPRLTGLLPQTMTRSSKTVRKHATERLLSHWLLEHFLKVASLLLIKWGYAYDSRFPGSYTRIE